VLGADFAPLIGNEPLSEASLIFDLVPGVAPAFTAYDAGIVVSAIPEPGTYALLVAGLLLLVAAGRRAGNARAS